MDRTDHTPTSDTTVPAPSQADEFLRWARTAPLDKYGVDVPRVDCSGCREDFPVVEVTLRSGWPLCLDCTARRGRAADRRATRELAYGGAR